MYKIVLCKQHRFCNRQRIHEECFEEERNKMIAPRVLRVYVSLTLNAVLKIIR